MKPLYTLLLLLLPIAASAQLTWQPIGPYGGNVTRIAADSNGALFAMADNGIYRSTDNAVSWARNTDVPVGVTFISFAIARGGTYFASTANAGVYRSIDRGVSWSGASTGLPLSFAWSIAANPVADEVLVATGPGVYRTTDNGATWALTGNQRIARPVLFAPDGTAFLAVDSGVMRSSDPTRAIWTWTDSAIATTKITGMVLVGNDTLWAGTAGDGVLRSVDGGATWTSRSVGLTSMRVAAIDHGYAGELYVSTEDGGLHRSTDGELWVRVNPSRVQFVASSILRAPSNRLFATCPKGIFYNDAHAIDEPWNPSRNGFANAVPRTVIATPGDDLYVMQFTGVFHRTTTPGGAWSVVDLDIPPGADATGMALDSSGALIASVKGVGLYRSIDQGSTWQRYAETMPSTRPTAIAIGPLGRIFVGTDSGRVMLSTDDGVTWSDDTLSTGRRAGINAIAVRGESVFAGMEDGIFASRNGGSTWDPNGVPILTYSLAVAPNGRVYAGSYQGRVYRSIDDGVTFQYSTTKQSAPLVSAIAVNARGDVLAGVQPGGMYLSRDSGATFTSRSVGLVNPAITAIAFDRTGRAYVGTYGGGVHVSLESTLGVEREHFAQGIAIALAPSPATTHAAATIELATNASVTVELFDALGVLVLTLHQGTLPPGGHRLPFDVTSLPAGTYLCRAVVNGVVGVTPFVVAR